MSVQSEEVLKKKVEQCVLDTGVKMLSGKSRCKLVPVNRQSFYAGLNPTYNFDAGLDPFK